MLDKIDLEKYLKPLLFIYLLKSLLFLSIIVILVASEMIGFNHDNSIVTSCDPYINYKLSEYQNQLQTIQFIISLIGFICGSCSLIKYLIMFVLFTRKHTTFEGQNQKITQNELRIYFLLNFLQAICIFNVTSRSIQTLEQRSSCNQQLNRTIIGILVISVIIILSLLAVLVILFKILTIFKKKTCIKMQFDFFNEQNTLRQNLFFNKEGYVNQILKIQNYTSNGSNILKDDVKKHFPSGYKKNLLLSTPQIMHKLKGGSKKKGKPAIQQEQDIDIQFIKSNTPVSRNINEQQNLTEEIKNNEKQNNKKISNLLKMNQKNYQQNPNEQSYQKAELTFNVISFSINKQTFRQQFKQESQKDQQNDTLNGKGPQKSLGNNLLKLKKVQGDAIQKKNNQSQKQKNKKSTLSPELQEQQELKKNFNLVHMNEKRKKGELNKNPQNIDQDGKYYFIDVRTIKKKSKFLQKKQFSTEKTQEFSTQKNVEDPNLLYGRKQWNPKQKRIGSTHQQRVLESLKKWQKTRKQQMLYNYTDSSQYTDSQEDASYSSEINDNQSENHQMKQVKGDQKLSQQQIQELKKEKSLKNSSKLFLHLRRKKLTGIEHKYKLYEDEDGFYDESSEQQQNQEQNKQMNQFQYFAQNNQKMLQKQQMQKQREKQRQKLKSDDKNKNTELQTQQAKILRFIWSKYVEPHQVKQPKHENQKQIQQQDEQDDQDQEQEQELEDENENEK